MSAPKKLVPFTPEELNSATYFVGFGDSERAKGRVDEEEIRAAIRAAEEEFEELHGEVNPDGCS